VTYLSSLIQLNNLNKPLGFVNQVHLWNVGSNSLFNSLISLSWDVSLLGENILNQRGK
jgi:hypothetical protein